MTVHAQPRIARSFDEEMKRLCHAADQAEILRVIFFGYAIDVVGSTQSTDIELHKVFRNEGIETAYSNFRKDFSNAHVFIAKMNSCLDKIDYSVTPEDEADIQAKFERLLNSEIDLAQRLYLYPVNDSVRIADVANVLLALNAPLATEENYAKSLEVLAKYIEDNAGDDEKAGALVLNKELGELVRLAPITDRVKALIEAYEKSNPEEIDTSKGYSSFDRLSNFVVQLDSDEKLFVSFLESNVYGKNDFSNPFEDYVEDAGIRFYEIKQKVMSNCVRIVISSTSDLDGHASGIYFDLTKPREHSLVHCLENADLPEPGGAN